MTAYTPPPAVVVETRTRAVTGRLTQESATYHAAAIKAELDSLEAVIAALPDGQAKALLKSRVLRLHNQLARGGQALNAHFQTAPGSPSPAGGDKDGDDDVAPATLG